MTRESDLIGKYLHRCEELSEDVNSAIKTLRNIDSEKVSNDQHELVRKKLNIAAAHLGELTQAIYDLSKSK